MTVTIDLPPELEARLRAAAERQGMDARLYVLRAVEERLWAPGDGLPPDEAALLEKVNLGVSEQDWARYHVLLGKRREEALAPGEQLELVALSDRIEEANARRVGHLVQLARLRDTTLDDLMAQLGINGSHA